MQYWHTFPLTAGDEDFTVTGYELRPFDNLVILEGPADALTPVVQGPTCAAADLDQDNAVSFSDVITLLAAWGDDENARFGDVDGDGLTGTSDLLEVLARFGETCGE